MLDRVWKEAVVYRLRVQLSAGVCREAFAATVLNKIFWD